VSAHLGVGHHGHFLTSSSIVVACLIAGNNAVAPTSCVNRGQGGEQWNSLIDGDDVYRRHH